MDIDSITRAIPARRRAPRKEPHSGWYGGGGMAIHMARYYMAVAAEQTLLADRWIDLEVKKKDDELIITSCLIDNIISFAIAF
jgi:hypothetical protein